MQMSMSAYVILIPILSSLTATDETRSVGENFSNLRNDVVRTMKSFWTTRRPESTAFHWRCVSPGSDYRLVVTKLKSQLYQFSELAKYSRSSVPFYSSAIRPPCQAPSKVFPDSRSASTYREISHI